MFDEHNVVHHRHGMHTIFWGMHGRRCKRGNTNRFQKKKKTFF